MWANAHLLFWLSLVPFSTAWLGASGGAKAPAALYGFTLLMPAISYTLLQLAIIKTHGEDSPLEKALGRDIKGKLSIIFYVAGISLAFVAPFFSYVFYIVVAIMWIIPDRRIASELNSDHQD